MFGTLIISLISDFEGGALVIQHGEQTKRFDYSGGVGLNKSHYVSFFADCEHSLEPVTRGTRIVLAYNLVVADVASTSNLSAATLTGKTAQLCGWVGEWEKDSSGPAMLAHVLEHKYTKTNLSFQTLKGRDREVVKMIQGLDVASTSPLLEVHLVLVEKQVITTARYDDRNRFRKRPRVIVYNNYDNYLSRGDEPVELEDVLDTTIRTVKVIGPKGVVKLNLSVDKKNLLSKDTVLFRKNASPDKEEFESYTGNSGPSLYYWYYTSLLVMWPKSRSIEVMCIAGFKGAIDTVLEEFRSLQPDAAQSLDSIIQYAASHPRLGYSTDEEVSLMFQLCCSAEPRYAIRVLRHLSKTHSYTTKQSYSNTTRAETLMIGLPGPKSESSLHLLICKHHTSSDLIDSVVDLIHTDKVKNLLLFCRVVMKLSQGEILAAVDALSSALNTRFSALSEGDIGNLISIDYIVEVMTFVCRFEVMMPFLAGRLTSIGLTQWSTFKIIANFAQTSSFPPLLHASKEHLLNMLTLLPSTLPLTLKEVEQVVSLFLACLHVRRQWNCDAGPLLRLANTIICRGSPDVLREIVAHSGIQEAIRVREACAISICRHRLSQLPTEEHAAFTWCMPTATLPDHPRVEHFLRSEAETFEERFSGIRYARSFVNMYCNDQVQRGFSMKGNEGGTGQNSWVKMQKTRKLYEASLRKYAICQEERQRLLQLLSESNDNGGVVTCA